MINAAAALPLLLTRLPPESVRVGVVSFGQQTVSLLGPLHEGIADAVLQERSNEGRQNWEFSVTQTQTQTQRGDQSACSD